MDQIRIETLGCRLNQIESESAAKFFIDKGFSVTMKSMTSAQEEDSNIILFILNTCAVTQKAEQKSRRIIRLALKKFPNACVLITGCYAQLSPSDIKKIDKRICVIGGQMKSRIANVPDLLNDYLKEKTWDGQDFAEIINNQITNIPPAKVGFPEESFKFSTSSFISHSRASLKIQDGCNSNCSYCTIHKARGHSVSIPVETAIKRVLELEKAGQEEVVITSVNIGQYKSLYQGQTINFTKFLRILLEESKKIKFRISSLYPEVVDDEFCEVIKNPRVCPHFHISVQSGSDKILKLMNRAYMSNTVIEACDKLRKAKINPFLACDIITGFPGENDQDFEDTMTLVKRCDFAWIHAFPFSERPGTPAVTFKNKVPQSISGQRVKELMTFAIDNKVKYINQFIGKELDAIFETVKYPPKKDDKENEFIYHAVTDNFIHCQIISKDVELANKSHKIKLTEALPNKIKLGAQIEAFGELIK